MRYKKGQVLLIVVMLLATAITVVLSISFTTTTDIQTTKLEEESQRALAAAEAGIEAALKQTDRTPIAIGDLAGLGESGITGDALISNSIGKIFTTPLLQKDEQYTFYLAEYDTGSSPPFKENSSYVDNITVYYGTSGDCEDMAVELTIIYDDPALPDYQLKRFVGDTGNKLGAGATGGSVQKTLLGQEFKCGFSPINISLYPNAKVLIARPLYVQTKVGFEGTNSDFKPQGDFITSTATVASGVTKKVQLFQSYPQIPAEFFVTRF